MAGPSVRVVMDSGDRDGSVAVNHPGRSGRHDDPRYRDLAARWRRGEYLPLRYSRAAVGPATARSLHLVAGR